MFNRSEIMREAWKTFKGSKFFTFGEALKRAWHNAKTIIAGELKKGDVVKIEYGDCDNWVTCTVLNVEDEKPFGYCVINAAVKGLDRVIKFCVRPEKRVIKLAA